MWWLVIFHVADLYAGCMRTQELFNMLALLFFIIRQEECILHFTRRVTGREVQCGEVIVVILNIRPFGNGKAHICENRREFLNCLRDRVDMSFFLWAGGERDVDGLSGKTCIKFLFLKRGLLGFYKIGNLIFQGIKLLPLGFALFRVHFTKGFHEGGDAPLFTQNSDTHIIKSL